MKLPRLPLLLFTLILIVSAEGTLALNSLEHFPVFVRPKENNVLMANATYAYNFVFTNQTSCTPIINVSATIVTDSYGVGFADLNVTNMTLTPVYLCEYRNTTLRTIHVLNRNIFENRTSDTDIKAFGYNHTSDLDQRYALTSQLNTT